jgi:hypothetical protein
MASAANRAGLTAGAIAALGLALAPLSAAPSASSATQKQAFPGRSGVGTFTPAAADPRLAAAFARSRVAASGFRFTPSSAATRPSRALTVAVRARSSVGAVSTDRPTVATPSLNIAPIAYSLGVSVGWKRFAVSGDIAQRDLGFGQGGRQAVDLGLSYGRNKWTTKVQLEAERPVGNAPRAINAGESVAVDFAGSYRLTRTLDLTAGVRYKTERDRLEPLADDRRDSQAVYIGTKVKF